MKAATHLAFAGLTGVVASGFGATPDIAGAAALGVGALLPDIDTSTSGAGKFIKPVSCRLERRFGHRTITHSLVGMMILAVASSWLLLLHPPVWSWLLVGVASHIVLDTANIMGVPLFWPAPLEAVIVHDKSWRVPYGSSREFSCLAAFSLAAVALVPLSLDGFSPWFHRALGTPRGAVIDYLHWRNDYQVWVDVKGHNLLTDEDVSARFQVIDALAKDILLVEDEAGRAYSVSSDDGANIMSSRVQAWRGDRIVSSVYRLDLSGRLVSDLISSLPKGARRIHITAALAITGETDTAPELGYFKRVKRSGGEVSLRSATVGDLTPLSHLVIDSGSAIIRAEYSPGSEALANLSVAASSPAVRSHILRIADLPSVVSGLVVGVGDRVEEGELIARYIDDSRLEADEAEVQAAQARIPDLERAIEIERPAHESKLAGLRQNVMDTKEKLGRVRYLVERDAAPKAQLVEAEAALRQAEQAELNERTSWTSRLNTLETQLREARLTISRAERARAVELERQWVKAPVSGLISDVRVTGVTTKGINLEVMILELQQTDKDDGEESADVG